MKLLFTLTKSPGFIFDCLIDMNKFASIHPVITKIDHPGGNRFLVHETMKMGFIPYSFTYPATVESDAAQMSVRIRATVQKITHIEMHFIIRADGETSIVEETISIKTILPVKGLIRKIFREQHEQLFKNIDKSLSSGKEAIAF